ncbi:MAG: sulfocyanin-like copper-binding protein [Chloroflexales bacterium]
MKRILRVGLLVSLMILSVMAVTGCTRRVEASTLTLPAAGAGTVVNVTARSFVINSDVSDNIPAGDITFKVSNTDVVTHETLIIKAQSPTGFDLPYDASISRIFENKIDKPGEVPDIQPGTTGQVTLNLEPGTYVLVCNLTAHFQAGMHKLIHVVAHK